MFFHALLVSRVDMGDDVRNGPSRRREQPYEQQYREMVARGEFAPVFRVSRRGK
jgi:hypothetical protein